MRTRPTVTARRGTLAAYRAFSSLILLPLSTSSFPVSFFHLSPPLSPVLLFRQSKATAVVQLYQAHPDRNNWSKFRTGVICFVKDNVKKSYYFRLVDIGVSERERGEREWEREKSGSGCGGREEGKQKVNRKRK